MERTCLQRAGGCRGGRTSERVVACLVCRPDMARPLSRVHGSTCVLLPCDVSPPYLISPSFYAGLGSRLPEFSPAEQAKLRGSADFFGLNHYGSQFVKDSRNDEKVQYCLLVTHSTACYPPGLAPSSLAACRFTGTTMRLQLITQLRCLEPLLSGYTRYHGD